VNSASSQDRGHATERAIVRKLDSDEGKSVSEPKQEVEGFIKFPATFKLVVNCSRCGNPLASVWNYCPYCGAEQKKEDAQASRYVRVFKPEGQGKSK